MGRRVMIVVGTLHGLPRKEINSILNEYYPDQVMVEASNEDVRYGRFEWYPSEMKHAYRWACRNGKLVCGYDIPGRRRVNVRPLNSREKKVIRGVESYARKHGWKILNKKGVLEKLIGDFPIMDADDGKREIGMLLNFRRRAIRNGKIVLFTGIGHLDFFEKHFPNAIFPYR